LRRTRSGRFDLAHAIDFERLRAAAAGDATQRAELLRALVPIGAALGAAPALLLDAPGVDDARHGRPVALARVIAGSVPAADVEPILLCDAAGEPVALARSSQTGLHVVRGFTPDSA
jgi:tRNA U55 pseudouridine synthase TruB